MTTTSKNSKKNKQTTSAFRKFFFLKKKNRPASDRVATESVNLSLPECLELATFTTSCTDEDSGETYFHGQCELSTSPGAYFSNSVGVEWSCWSEDTPRDLLNDGSARDYGFDGACNFRDWYRALKPNDLPECDHVCTDCSPGASWFVGACYSAEFEAWLAFSVRTRWRRGAAAGGGGNFLQLATARPQPSANRSTERSTTEHASSKRKVWISLGAWPDAGHDGDEGLLRKAIRP